MAEERYLTPPQVARLLGVGSGKVLTWIRSGELKAIDVATVRTLGSRPRYRVKPAALEEFEARRQVTPPPKAARRGLAKIPSGVIPFYSKPAKSAGSKD